MAFTGSSKFAVDLLLTDVLDDQNPRNTVALSRKTTWTDGTGANAAETFFHDERTLGNGANEALDFADSANALKDAFGNSLNLTAIKLLIIHNKSGNGASMTVGPPASLGWITAMAISDLMTIVDGGTFAIEAPTAGGYAVTADTGDLFTITNLDGSNSLTYSITIIGLT